MKLAIISDIHGNEPALHAVIDHVDAWQPDQVVVGGDVVNRGPRSFECLRLIQKRKHSQGWRTVRGNHEDYVIKQAEPDTVRSGSQFEINRISYWTYQQLNGDIAALAAMPDYASVSGPDGSEVRVTHASMSSNRDGIFPGTSDESLRQKIAPAPAVFCTAHTHYPLTRRIDDTLVVNTGAVGSPADGDTRASYAQLTWQSGQWHAEIIRVDYDRQQTEHDFKVSGFFKGGGPIAQLLHIEWRMAQHFFPLWSYQYEKHVLDGEIALEESVRKFLDDYNVVIGA